MFERYTEAARRTIFYARHQASHRGLDEITTADLVLGAAQAVRGSEDRYSCLHGRWEQLVTAFGGPASGPCPPDQNWPLSEISKKAIAYAALEAQRDRRYSIDPDHLVRGVLRTKDETCGKLAGVGLDLNFMRKASVAMHRAIPDRRGSVHFWWTVYRKRALLFVALLLLAAAVVYLRSQN